MAMSNWGSGTESGIGFESCSLINRTEWRDRSGLDIHINYLTRQIICTFIQTRRKRRSVGVHTKMIEMTLRKTCFECW